MAGRGHHKRSGGEVNSEKEEERGVESDKGRLDYTAESNVVPEAEGKRRKHGGRMKKAHGGPVHHGKHHVSHAHHESAVVVHQHKKRGGDVKHVDGEGMKSHRRHDRPGRKRGGSIGATMHPLSSAAKVEQATEHHADADEE